MTYYGVEKNATRECNFYLIDSIKSFHYIFYKFDLMLLYAVVVTTSSALIWRKKEILPATATHFMEEIRSVDNNLTK